MHDKIAITKDLFLLIVQDRAVQKLMDDLDLPHDRANLFEIIDADGKWNASNHRASARPLKNPWRDQQE